MSILNALVGAALLLFGRKVFWLFVAGAGFVAGMSLTSRVLQGPEWVAVLVGLGIGFLAALLALVLQRFAIGLAGFLVGGYLALQFLTPLFNLDQNWWPWLAFVLGGILGAVLVNALITETLGARHVAGLLVFILLLVIGVAFQVRELRKDRRKH